MAGTQDNETPTREDPDLKAEALLGAVEDGDVRWFMSPRSLRRRLDQRDPGREHNPGNAATRRGMWAPSGSLDP